MHSTPLPRHPAELVYCSRQTSPTMLLYSLSSWSGAGPNSRYHQQLPFSSHPRTHARLSHTTSCYTSWYTHRATACGASRNIASLSVSDSLEILHLDSDAVADVAEVKRAYYSRMRDIHPDVNPDEDTTDTAALVNAAYAALLKEAGDSASGVVVTGDAFDQCDGAVNSFFVSPFVCGTDPFLWRELRAAVSDSLIRLGAVPSSGAAEMGDDMYAEVSEVDMEEALNSVGLRAAPGAVVWLTEKQKSEVEVLMDEMEASLAFEVAEWMLVDSLLRAERANRRAWQS